MDYTLTRSKRRTVALYIRDGAVEVRAPLRTPKPEIDKFVASKEKWIKGKLEFFRQRAERRQSFSLDYGDTVLCRNRLYQITAKEGIRVEFDGERFYMPPGLSPEQIKNSCVQIYRMIAKSELTEKTLDFAKRMSVTTAAVKIGNAKYRWGSCSAKKSINYSWRLIMADDDLIDYVVVHELAHITEMNHSERFWAIVESVFPDYRERKKRLKELQLRLGGEDWE